MTVGGFRVVHIVEVPDLCDLYGHLPLPVSEWRCVRCGEPVIGCPT